MTDVTVGGLNVDRLRSLVERIERVKEEIKELQGDVRDLKAEAKSAGYDPKAIEAIIKLRAMNKSDRDYQESVLDTYRRALDV